MDRAPKFITIELVALVNADDPDVLEICNKPIPCIYHANPCTVLFLLIPHFGVDAVISPALFKKHSIAFIIFGVDAGITITITQLF